MRNSTVLWIISTVVSCVMIYALGTGVFTEHSHDPINPYPNPPTIHKFELLGERGGLPFFIAFIFINVVFFLFHFVSHGRCIKDNGDSYSFSPAVWYSVFILIALMTACYITSHLMGPGHFYCLELDGNCGYELEATRDQIGTFITCPKCGHEVKVEEYWWH